MRSRAASWLIVAAAAASLAACDKPKPRRATAPAAPTAAPIAAPAPTAPLPALPAWAREVIGKPMAQLFPGELKPCIGNTDNVEQKYVDGTKIIGWGWDPATKAAIPRVILADASGLAAGAGETGVARPDVTAAKPEIKDPATGWAAYTRRTTGPIDAYGMVDGGKSLCKLGHLEF
jgi:hypothetical protein